MTQLTSPLRQAGRQAGSLARQTLAARAIKRSPPPPPPPRPPAGPCRGPALSHLICGSPHGRAPSRATRLEQIPPGQSRPRSGPSGARTSWATDCRRDTPPLEAQLEPRFLAGRWKVSACAALISIIANHRAPGASRRNIARGQRRGNRLLVVSRL